MVLYMYVLCAYKHGSVYQFQMYQISLGHQISRAQHILSVHKTKSVDGKEWLCNTCKAALKKGHWPKLSVANGLGFPDMPDALKLYVMEERVISPGLLFFQMWSHYLG